jgi:hypothetical protein
MSVEEILMAWLKGLGELELATRIAMLKDRKLGEEELRIRVLGLASKRCTNFQTGTINPRYLCSTKSPNNLG